MELYKPGFTYLPTHLDQNGNVLSAEMVSNIIPVVGLNYIIGAALTGVSQYTSWYLGLYDNNWTPVGSDTMTTLISNAGENKGYTGSARQGITLPSISDGEVTTLGAPNIFEFSASATIRGAFISTAPTWDSTTGLLLSAVLFPSPKNVSAGEELKVPIGFSLTSA